MEDVVRRTHAIKQYSEYNINFEFMAAIDPSMISNPPQLITIEEASLCVTNKHCIEMAKINGYSSVVIMEDDFRFNEGWLENFIEFYRNLPNDWDLLYLGQAEWWNEINPKSVTPVNDYVDQIHFGCGAHFIVIRNTIYDLCINLIGGLTDKVDVCYWNVMKDKNYHCYTAKMSLANSLSSPEKRFSERITGFNLTDYFPSRLSNVS